MKRLPGELLKRAFDRAAVLHQGQSRKYPGVSVPYVSHVAGVVSVLARHQFDEEVLAAGALHDVIEDCGATSESLEQEFGARVAALVRHVSESDKSLSWEERKHAYIENFGRKPWDAQAISLADKIDNFLSILVCAADHGNPWPMFKRGREAQLERFDALAEKASVLPSHKLIDEYLETLESVRRLPA